MKKMVSNKPVILIDGSSYLYRAYHALPPLINSKGHPTGAIYGVLNMLKSILSTYDPEYIAVIFDAKGKTFRDDMYPLYKANRPPMPDDLRQQIEPLHKIVAASGLPLMAVSGVEADDVIGTLAVQALALKQDVLISTGDKDIAQLVNEHVTLINTMTNHKMDRQGVIDKFGLPPERIIDYLTLVGDTSDNVPGVPKVGPKTAVKWLAEYGTLDNIIANADKIKGKVGENLRASLDHIPLSKQLVTIKCDVELDHSLETLKRTEMDKEQLATLLDYLEIRSWGKELSGHRAERKAAPNEYETIHSKAQLQQWIQALKRAEQYAFDTETTSLEYMNAEIVGVSFALKAGKACYIPLAHNDPDAPKQLNREEVLRQLKPLLEDDQPKKIGQNLKYDMEVLANYDIHLRGIKSDTMLESYVHNSVGSRHDMDTLAFKHLNHKTTTFEEVAGKGAKQVTFDQVPVATAAPYAAEDADITLQLHEHFAPQIKEEASLQKVLDTIELPLIPVLSKLERNGVLVDAYLLGEQSFEIALRLSELETMSFESAGETFNLNSPAQLQTILYEKLQLPILKKTPKGQPSTAEPVLTELALDYPLPKLIIEHRQLSKLKSTYTDQLPNQINEKTGRVHSSYHQAVTATGRLSSSDPNLQNIPVRTEQGRRIRKAFIARPGYKLLAADYSQIELRIMAHLSSDEGLLNAFKNDKDIHSTTAADIFHVNLADVTPNQRRSAKAINFGLIYGMSAFGLAKQLQVERKAAQNYIDLYFERYPGVKEYMTSTRELAHEKGYVETLFGRRLYLPLINTRNKMQQQAAERAAINAPMQGTAADIIKLAMIQLNQWISETDLDLAMIMQVHDELVFEVKEDDLDKATAAIKQHMEGTTTLSVPLIVDIGIGDNWEEAH
jgi:DNA polymerase-1